MDFYCDERKTLLYADLFKGRRKSMAVGNENQSSVCDSSSSGFSSPFTSELGSSEGEDEDFIAELTRQMAECMLQEEEDDDDDQGNAVAHCEFESCEDSAAIKAYDMDQTLPLQVYQLRNQPPVSKQVPVSRVSRVKGTVLTQQKQLVRTEQHYVRYKGRDWGGIGHGGKRHVGSGMQAIFLRGSGSRNGSSGTGVFLPTTTNDPVQLTKKSGCSTVLIPTRVLQALELHFNRVSDSAAPPLRVGSPTHSCPKGDEWRRSKGQGNRYRQVQIRPSNKDEGMQLPQEWSY